MSAWGQSWGRAWGNAWGALEAEALFTSSGRMRRPEIKTVMPDTEHAPANDIMSKRKKRHKQAAIALAMLRW